MFARHYFGGAYFGLRYFGDGDDAVPVASAAAVWAYVLSNGKTAGENLVEVNAGIAALLLRSCLDDQVQGIYTAGDALRILLAVAAGKSSIVDLGGGAATVQFRAIDDSVTTVSADMQNSERIAVTLDPSEST